MGTLTIGKLAKTANVNVETIRYYERRALIPKPRRKESGYREYSEEMVQRIQFIKHAKELGFSLKEIHELLSLKLDPKTSCSEVKNRAETKIADIEEKVKTLQRMKKALVKLTKACSGKGPVIECPILEALERR
ncbi:MAG: Hg(II)-responsive transcriptional regulator [Thermodesulfovibrionia bacterium]|nr:Hg(II)-responsive transcriptional regulator [Thermodesulfovibrionia bacterium]